MCAIVGHLTGAFFIRCFFTSRNDFPDIDTARMLAMQTMAGAWNHRGHDWLGWIEAGVLNLIAGYLDSYFPAVPASLAGDI